MPRYALNIQISAVRLPDPEPPQPAIDPGADPMTNALKTLGRMLPPNLPVTAGFHPPAGMNLSKSVEITTESFAALADTLGKFDALAEQLEIESQVKHS